MLPMRCKSCAVQPHHVQKSGSRQKAGTRLVPLWAQQTCHAPGGRHDCCAGVAGVKAQVPLCQRAPIDVCTSERCLLGCHEEVGTNTKAVQCMGATVGECIQEKCELQVHLLVMACTLRGEVYAFMCVPMLPPSLLCMQAHKKL